MSQLSKPISAKQAQLFVQAESQLRLIAQVLMAGIDEEGAVFEGIKDNTLLYSVPDEAIEESP